MTTLKEAKDKPTGEFISEIIVTISSVEKKSGNTNGRDWVLTNLNVYDLSIPNGTKISQFKDINDISSGKNYKLTNLQVTERNGYKNLRLCKNSTITPTNAKSGSIQSVSSILKTSHDNLPGDSILREIRDILKELLEIKKKENVFTLDDQIEEDLDLEKEFGDDPIEFEPQKQ